VGYFREVDDKCEIARCVAFFKQDAPDSTWFLYTTSIRIVESRHEFVGDPHSATAVNAADLPMRPSLVPLLLTVQNANGGNGEAADSIEVHPRKSVIAPPPRRLRGNFFTPAAPADEAALERASQARRDQLQERRDRLVGERTQLHEQLEKLVKESYDIHNTARRGGAVARAKSASPFERSMSGAPPPPSRLGRSHDERRSSPRTRGKSRAFREASFVAEDNLEARKLAADAAMIRRTAPAAVRRWHSAAIEDAEAVADALYPITEDMIARRTLLVAHTSRPAYDSGGAPEEATFALPWRAWRWIAERADEVGALGVHVVLAHDDDDDAADATSAPAVTVQCRLAPPLPSVGGLKLFGGKLQSYALSSEPFIRGQVDRAATRLEAPGFQQLLAELRDATVYARDELDEAGPQYWTAEVVAAWEEARAEEERRTAEEALAAEEERERALAVVRAAEAEEAHKRHVSTLHQDEEAGRQAVADDEGAAFGHAASDCDAEHGDLDDEAAAKEAAAQKAAAHAEQRAAAAAKAAKAKAASDQAAADKAAEDQAAADQVAADKAAADKDTADKAAADAVAADKAAADHTAAEQASDDRAAADREAAIGCPAHDVAPNEEPAAADNARPARRPSSAAPARPGQSPPPAATESASPPQANSMKPPADETSEDDSSAKPPTAAPARPASRPTSAAPARNGANPAAAQPRQPNAMQPPVDDSTSEDDSSEKEFVLSPSASHPAPAASTSGRGGPAGAEVVITPDIATPSEPTPLNPAIAAKAAKPRGGAAADPQWPSTGDITSSSGGSDFDIEDDMPKGAKRTPAASGKPAAPVEVPPVATEPAAPAAAAAAAPAADPDWMTEGF
jgi:hypothetical protein